MLCVCGVTLLFDIHRLLQIADREAYSIFPTSRTSFKTLSPSCKQNGGLSLLH